MNCGRYGLVAGSSVKKSSGAMILNTAGISEKLAHVNRNKVMPRKSGLFVMVVILLLYHGIIIFNYNKIITPNPKKTKNPTTSVTVVKTTEDAIAGSAPHFCSINGTLAPANPATSKLAIRASPMTMPIKGLSNHAHDNKPPMMANRIPFNPPTSISLDMIRSELLVVSSPVAKARTATVRAWVPALPPILATMGIRMARATIFSMALSNKAITMLAKIAVTRLTASQLKRERKVTMISE